jgi:tripartite-type tricarboxylate transporter receptor subunit TctC
MQPSFHRSCKASAAIGAIAIAAVTSLPGVVAAQTAAEFYKDKQISLVIGFNPGGGFDAYGRTVARHFGRHIPGQPTIVVKNVPGAGSIIAANNLFNTAPKDGTEIGLVADSAALDPLFGLVKTRYEPLKFNWLGSVNRSVAVCVAWHTSKTKSAKDLFERETVIGTSGTSTITFPLALNSVLGTRMKLVSGYRGTAGLMLALERGEIEGMCGQVHDAVKTQHPEWHEKKLVRNLIQIGVARSPELADVPFVMDFAKSEADRKVLALIVGTTVMGRPFLTPPGVPADRVAALRSAFQATMKDPAFLADASKLKIEVSPITGEEIERFVKEAYATPKPIIERARVVLASQPKGKGGDKQGKAN